LGTIAIFALSVPCSAAEPVDRFGDPLPPGAIMRLGTVRLRQPGGCSCVAFSPSGKVVASGGPRSARLWDVTTAKKVAEVPHPAATIAFSPDGKQIALGGGYGNFKVVVWDIETQKESLSVTLDRDPRFDTQVQAIAFDPLGGWLATATDAGVILWDLDSHKKLLTLAHGEEDGQDEVRFAISRDGSLVALSTKSNIRIWNLDAGGDPVVIKKAHDREVTALVFSHDNERLISGGRRFELVEDEVAKTKYLKSHSQIRIWDTASGRRIGEILKEEPSQVVNGLALTSGGSKVVAALTNEIRVFQWPSGKLEGSLAPEAEVHRRRSIAVSPVRDVLAIAMDDATLQIWDLKKRELRFATPESHTNRLWAAAYSPDGTIIATGSGHPDGTVRLWNSSTGKPLRRLVFSPRCMGLASVTFSADGKLLAAVGSHRKGIVGTVGAVKLWRVPTGEVVRELELPQSGFGLAFSPDASRLAVSLALFGSETELGRDEPVRIFNLESGKEERRLKPIDLATSSWMIGFSPDGKRLVSLGQRDPLCVWDVSQAKLLNSTVITGGDVAAISPDARFIVTGRGFRRGKIGVWDISSGKLLREIDRHTPGYGAHGIDISRDGQLVACGCQEDNVGIVDLSSGRELLRLQSPDAHFWSVAFSPDGRRVLTGMDDGSALIWDLSKAHEKLGLTAKEKP
jgi:WD40 repeat protein